MILSCPRFLCCASQTYTRLIDVCMWCLYCQGYEKYATELLVILLTEDG